MKRLKERKVKNVNDLFRNISLGNSGDIICMKERSQLYQIIPLSIIEKERALKEKIYNSFYSIIRGLPSHFQIIILQENLDFSEQIIKCTKRLETVQSEKLKKAFSCYIDKLNKIKGETKNNFQYYLVVPSEQVADLIIQAFKPLFEMGLVIKKIDNCDEIRRVIIKSIKKDVV
ncbi:MAG: hypothetical protein IKV94_02140 [Clostridia bacterium]|nr:hypothetical protein [Clostridia bacterium]